ncbi:FAD-dependent oxidoreductase [Nocardia sp. NPDC004068]|uniref:FAD-dependent oxidoreductase n=1 Tax=Nocardia sp. NPDC004068 TaxID=3364303 RepID=UPI003677FB0F
MTSMWLKTPRPPAHPPLTPGLRFDVVVVGGGLTGLVTALLLADQGRTTAVLEARRLGAVTTGNTTGKVSLLQGTRASSIARRHSGRTLREYTDANRAGQQWLIDYCATHGIEVQREAAYTYAQTEAGLESVRAELAATRKAGLDTEFVTDLDVPFPVHGAIRLGDQVQLDAIDVVDALDTDLEARGVTVFEGTRVQSMHSRDGADHVLRTEHGDVAADTVVLATGTPILDRGGFFARVTAQRSYAAAFEVSQPIPRGMYLSADSPVRSLRYVPSERGELLLVGGSGHGVGRTGDARSHADDVVAWTRRWFPEAEPVYRWSAQDYKPSGELPYAGPILPGHDRILVATGYAKWGLANAVAAAHTLVGRITGAPAPWQSVFDTWSPRELAALPTAVRDNGEVALRFSKGWLSALAAPLTRRGETPAPPAEGTGHLEHHGVAPCAVSTVDGHTHRLSAVCPHLGGVVEWNNAERSWDCPLHGSRFAPDGTVLEGPATTDLAPARGE